MTGLFVEKNQEFVQNSTFLALLCSERKNCAVFLRKIFKRGMHDESI
jgi:hypothetical protein